jgi:hypothetical protein
MRDAANCGTLGSNANTESRAMICNPDEAGVGGNSTVDVHDIGPEHYESSQYTLVERVCEFLERYAIKFGSNAEILLPRNRQ